MWLKVDRYCCQTTRTRIFHRPNKKNFKTFSLVPKPHSLKKEKEQSLNEKPKIENSKSVSRHDEKTNSSFCNFADRWY